MVSVIATYGFLIKDVELETIEGRLSVLEEQKQAETLRILNLIAGLYVFPNKGSILYPNKQSPDNSSKNGKLENNSLRTCQQRKRRYKNKQ
jgi:hypothetical protein